MNGIPIGLAPAKMRDTQKIEPQPAGRTKSHPAPYPRCNPSCL